MLNIFFVFIFSISVFYLLKEAFNRKKAAEMAKDAVYPLKEEEFSSILVPNEWKEMKHLSKTAKSYQFVMWGTAAAIILLSILLFLVISTNWLASYSLNVAYLFFVIIFSIKHQGNLFILEKGLIINGKFYSSQEIQSYHVEQIIRWHSLYGLHSRVNNGFKLTFKLKKKMFQPNYMVVEKLEHLEKILALLEEKEIPCSKKNEQFRCRTIGDNQNKA
ncbi:MAG: hypothetical protein ABF649_08205 [Bacillus sp. (in: firmicutes)]